MEVYLVTAYCTFLNDSDYFPENLYVGTNLHDAVMSPRLRFDEPFFNFDLFRLQTWVNGKFVSEGTIDVDGED